MFFDTHCHLDAPALLPMLPGLLQDAGRQGIIRFLLPGVHPEGWQGISSLSRGFPEILPAFGVHPMHADLVNPSALSQLRHVSRNAVAIGEIGLDYLLESPGRSVQQEAFRAQLRLAIENSLPVLIHCRKAFPDLLAILSEEGIERIGGVMHAFSGSAEIARQCLRLGLHISVGGSVTYANAVRPVAVAASVPPERLLLETDAPDMAPEPYRGRMNLPSYLLATAARVAEIRGISIEELGRQTTANAWRLFVKHPEIG
jgi:TatD DNase family protein